LKIRATEQLPGCWVAVDDDTYDGPPSPIGRGFSEQEAIDDLLEQLNGDEEREAFERASWHS
jgi:hypothetical protein